MPQMCRAPGTMQFLLEDDVHLPRAGGIVSEDGPPHVQAIASNPRHDMLRLCPRATVGAPVRHVARVVGQGLFTLVTARPADPL